MSMLVIYGLYFTYLSETYAHTHIHTKLMEITLKYEQSCY